MITSFRGEYRFLSNFYPAWVVFDGVEYATVEHAYQAAKTLDLVARATVANAHGAGAAKRLGKILDIRPEWESVKVDVMLALVRQKFSDPALRSKLLGTGNAQLVEGNTWNDRFWGVCEGQGENHLGRILMQVRSELREDEL